MTQALRPLLTLTESFVTYFAARHFEKSKNGYLFQICSGAVFAITAYGILKFCVVDNTVLFHGMRRATSVFSGPNVFGGYLVLAVVLPLGLLLSRSWLILNTSCFVLVFASLILTKSLGAFIGCAALTGMLFLLRLPESERKRALRGSAGIALILLCYVAFHIISQGASEANIATHGRYFLWRAGFSMASGHPLLGVGLGQFSRELGSYYPALGDTIERKTHAHNLFVQVLAEQGVLALGLLCSFFVLYFRKIFLQRDLLKQMTICAVVGSLAHSLIDYTNLVCALSWLFWLYLGISSAEERAETGESRADMAAAHSGIPGGAALVSLILGAILLVFPAPAQADDWQKMLRLGLKNGGAFAVDETGTTVFSYREQDLFIPASTLKVATIFAGLEELGESYRFPTEFYKTADGSLAVKGFGDPLLISEELEQIANKIAEDVKGAKNLILDDTYFSSELSLDGAEGSSNPYDAQNGALIANFNTVYLRRLKDGRLVSGEPQTPIVPLVQNLRTIRKGSEERFNLGFDRKLAVKYFAELLRAFLEKRGVHINGEILRAPIPPGAKLFYTHLCPKTLAEISQHTLEFSTNFSANQILLALGAKKFSPPATYEKGAKALDTFLRQRVGLTEFHVVEGSGLSRKNQITPRQMVKLIKAFRPHEALLPLKEGFYHAKTGSLTGVNSLAGYMDVPGRGRITFAFIVNSAVPFRHKYYLADMLYRGLTNPEGNFEEIKQKVKKQKKKR